LTEESRSPPVRLLVVDDQALMRDGLASLLSLEQGITVVGTASNGKEAVSQVIALEPDVILMDVRMPVIDGLAATVQIRHDFPDTLILMLTTFDDDALVSAALQAGANGYLLKDLPPADLAKAIRAVNSGVYQLDPTIAGKLIANRVVPPNVPPPSAMAPVAGLTEREREVLKLVSTGATNREIAEALYIGEATVKSPTQVVGQVPPNYVQGGGTIVTGTAADTAQAAAVAAYAEGTVDRVVLLSSGDYEVHMIAVNRTMCSSTATSPSAAPSRMSVAERAEC
jgi:DNA-binding NarL/FixJ family response regulator